MASWNVWHGRPSTISFGSTEPASERRQVTVLFADMAGFTSIAERLGEEGTYSLIQPIYELMAGTVREQGGVVKDFTGDGIMALFGVPDAMEDAPLRACQAGLQIQEKLAATAADIEATHGLRPQIRIGINSGSVVVARIRGENADMVAGDTVNLASRLQVLAEPGQVLLSEATYRLVEGLVDASFFGTHFIKGKAEPQKAYRLDAVKAGASRFERAVIRGLTSYVGRHLELELLERSLIAARTDTRVIDIAAEAGLGKSRLLHEFRQRIGTQRAFVLSGNCSSDGQQTPFLPFIEVIRGWFQVSPGEARQEVANKLELGLGAVGACSPENVALLLNLLGVGPPGEALRGLDGLLIGRRTRDLLFRLIEARSRASYVLLLLEDLHWIDTASEELLASIVGSETSVPLLIVHTRRPEYDPPWSDQANVTTLKVAPLSATETSLIMRQRLEVDELPVALERGLLERAEGNPLFAEELASDLLERGVIRRVGSVIEHDPAAVSALLPSGLQAVLTARIDRLPQADRMLLQTAAVIGARFEPSLLAAVSGHDAADIEARLQVLHQADIVRPDERTGEYLFKHVLVRDALYERLLSGRRSDLHGKVAEQIERRGSNRIDELAEVLAYHYGRTERGEKAFHYLSLAGKKALDIYSLDEAEQYLRTALHMIEPSLNDNPLASADAIVRLLEVVQLKGNHAELRLIAERYLPHLETMGDTVHLVFALSFYSNAIGQGDNFVSAEATAKRAVEIAERIGDARARAYTYIGLLAWSPFLRSLSLDEAKRIGARMLGDSIAAADNHAINCAYYCLASEYLHRGLPNEAREWARALMAAGRKRGDPRALGMAFWVLGWIDAMDEDFEGAVRNAEEAMRAAVTPQDRAFSGAIKASAKILHDRVDEGVAELQQLRDWARESGSRYLENELDIGMGLGLLRTGRIGEGIRLIERSMSVRDAVGDRFGVLERRGMLVKIYLEMLTGGERPPLGVVLRNLGVILWVKLFGARRVEKLLEGGEELFDEGSTFRAHYLLSRGLLCKIRRQHNRAKEHLEKARVIAQSQHSTGTVKRIDAALRGL